nr:immunoglobulin heavy chain junction region [Mus musculus]
ITVQETTVVATTMLWT